MDGIVCIFLNFFETLLGEDNKNYGDTFILENVPPFKNCPLFLVARPHPPLFLMYVHKYLLLCVRTLRLSVYHVIFYQYTAMMWLDLTALC